MGAETGADDEDDMAREDERASRLAGPERETGRRARERMMDRTVGG